jgi:aminotransferase
MTISKRAQSIPPSGIRRFFDIAATMTDVISLGIGEPDFVTPDRIRAAGISSIEHGETKYTSNGGTLQLRSALADHLARLYHVRYSPTDELLITVGVSEALACAMLAMIDPGDEVIIPEPCFVAYKPSVMLAGGIPVVVETRVEDGFQVTGEEIEHAITPQTKAILIGYPNNPTGAVMTRDHLLQVARVAEGNDLTVFSDEIYDRLVYGIEHVCFSSLPGMRERTVLLGGFSKDYAMTGWRVGYVAANPEVLGAILKVHQYVIMSAPTMSQFAALEGLRHADADVQAMVREYDKRRQTIVAGFNAIGLPTFEPRGAFYAFPDIRPTGLTSEEFSERLIHEEHVAVIPGNAFGRSGEGFVRAAYAASMTQIEEALTRIERFVKRTG